MTEGTGTARLRLDREDTAVLLVDFQERLHAAMDPEAGRKAASNARILLEGARALEVPVVLTEQYPRGLGPTLPDLLGALPGTRPVEKIEFSCLRNDAARQALEAIGRRKVLVAGMETHICVYQTVLDLAEHGFTPHVLADACLSRTEANHERGLALAEEAGAVVSSVETALFQLLGRASGEAFKTISKLVR